jgi:hypothetical protein
LNVLFLGFGPFFQSGYKALVGLLQFWERLDKRRHIERDWLTVARNLSQTRLVYSRVEGHCEVVRKQIVYGIHISARALCQPSINIFLSAGFF